MRPMNIAALLVFLMSIAFVPALSMAGDGAGCGLGAQLFKGQSGIVPNVLAATTNAIFSNQQFGISSGTSGCNADSVVQQEHEKSVFVAININALSRDAARGAGPSLDALSELMGCPMALTSDFSAVAQTRYPELATQNTPQAWLSTFEAELRQTPVLAAGCTRIG